LVLLALAKFWSLVAVARVDQVLVEVAAEVIYTTL
jgi:hypothetical protein